MTTYPKYTRNEKGILPDDEYAQYYKYFKLCSNLAHMAHQISDRINDVKRDIDAIQNEICKFGNGTTAIRDETARYQMMQECHKSIKRQIKKLNEFVESLEC